MVVIKADLKVKIIDSETKKEYEYLTPLKDFKLNMVTHELEIIQNLTSNISQMSMIIINDNNFWDFLKKNVMRK
jgi:hypothetical protein